MRKCFVLRSRDSCRKFSNKRDQKAITIRRMDKSPINTTNAHEYDSIFRNDLINIKMTIIIVDNNR